MQTKTGENRLGNNILAIAKKLFVGGMVLALTGLGAVAPRDVEAATYSVYVDTSTLIDSPGLLAFDFIDGGPSNNVAIVSEFSSDASVDAAVAQGGVDGTLLTQVRFTDLEFLNEYLTSVTFGTFVSFIVELSGNPPQSGALPDALSLFFLADELGTSISPTSDPTGADSLFSLGIDGTETGAIDIFSDSAFVYVVATNPVPTPSAGVLLTTGILGLAGFLRPNRCKLRAKN